MSLKALQRRAREAQHWLGQRALPLWSETGMLREGGVIAQLQLNHRPGNETALGDRQAQEGMARLFALAPATGFDRETAEALVASLTAAAQTAAEPEGEPVAARGLKSVCDDLRLRLITLVTAEGEDAILTSRAACRTFDTLMDEFLTPEGGWIAGYDERGLLTHSVIPSALAGPIAAAFEPLLPLAQA